MSYPLLRQLLFRLEPERAHGLALTGLKRLHAAGLASRCWGQVPPAPKSLLGLTFTNPVGLAAGLDKNGDYIDALGGLGVGFVEVGTVTPRPQPGNPPPRLFRLPQAEALINRLGFNNKGVDYLVARLQQARFPGVIGVNIGKNRDTPLERAEMDYLVCLRAVYPHAGYVTVNISSPNTPGLRELQGGAALARFLDALKAEQATLAARYGGGVPLLVKIAPDLSDDEIAAIAETVRDSGIEGVVATNTTTARPGVEGLPGASEEGGLSGAPLRGPANTVLAKLRQALGPEIPLIGVGGIMSGADAWERVQAGADLVQLYTGFIYRGPALIREVAAAMRR